MVGEIPKSVKEEKVQTDILEGAEELLVSFANSLNDLAFSSEDGARSESELSSSAARYWFKDYLKELPKVATPYDAVQKFRDFADERKVIIKENFSLKEKNSIITGTFLSQDCPYRNCCLVRKKEGKKFLCFRAVPFTTAIQLMADKNYRRDVIYEQTTPGKICVIKGSPSEISFKIGLSYKLSSGTIKIHEMDMAALGLDVIETVKVTPSRKEIEKNTLIAMAYSHSKYSPGMVLMNINDAKKIGLDEKDTVYVRLAKQGEQVNLVKDFELDENSYKVDEKAYELPEVASLEPKTREETTPEQKETTEKQEDAEEKELMKKNEKKDKENPKPLQEKNEKTPLLGPRPQESKKENAGEKTEKKGKIEKKPEKEGEKSVEKEKPVNTKDKKDLEEKIDKLRK